jgi:hypothetical protein
MADWGALSTMLVRSVGLSQPRELSSFSVDASAEIDSPVERELPVGTLRTHGIAFLFVSPMV